jgi:hypothetical protein
VRVCARMRYRCVCNYGSNTHPMKISAKVDLYQNFPLV